MAPHTQAAGITIKQQYQTHHQWPWSANNATTNTGSNNSISSNSSNSSNVSNSSSGSNGDSLNVNGNNNQPANGAITAATANAATALLSSTTGTALNAAGSIIGGGAPTATSSSASVNPTNKLKRLQPAQSESSGNSNAISKSNSHGGLANGNNSKQTAPTGAKRIRSTSVEKVCKSVGTNTGRASGGPPALVAVGSGTVPGLSNTKKLTQMAIVSATNIGGHLQQQHQHSGGSSSSSSSSSSNSSSCSNAPQLSHPVQPQPHQPISSATGTTAAATTISKSIKANNLTASELTNANKITGYFKSQMKTTNTYNNLKKNIKTIAGRATTMQTTTASTMTTAESDAEITTTTELMTTTSTVLQQKIIKTATVAGATTVKGTNLDMEKYLKMIQQQQQVVKTSITGPTAGSTPASAASANKMVERKTARIAPTVSVTRKMAHSIQGGLGVGVGGQSKKPVTIAPRTADPKMSMNFNQQIVATATATAVTTTNQTKTEQIIKSQQPTVLLTAIRIPQATQTPQQQPQQPSAVQQQDSQQQVANHSQQQQQGQTHHLQQQQQQQHHHHHHHHQYKQVVQQQSQAVQAVGPSNVGAPKTPTKLGPAVFQFHQQATPVMPNLVQISNILPTASQAAVTATNKLNGNTTNAAVSTVMSGQAGTNLLVNNATGLTAARLNNTAQYVMNVIKFHQIQQQQQQQLQQQQQQPQPQQQQPTHQSTIQNQAVSQHQHQHQHQQSITMEAAMNMNLNGMLTKPATITSAVPFTATATTVVTNPSQAQGKTFTIHPSLPTHMFPQVSAASAAFTTQPLLIPGGYLVNAATIPTMLTPQLTTNMPALHPIQPSHQPPTAAQLPNITAIIQQNAAAQQQSQQQQQQQQALQTQQHHQLLTNISPAVLSNIQASAKLGHQTAQFVPISSHLYLNNSNVPPALTTASLPTIASSLTTPITISTSTIPSGSTTVAQSLSPPPLVATVPTYSTTGKPIMNTLNNQKIIIASATGTPAGTNVKQTQTMPSIKPITSTEPPKLVPVMMSKPQISITPVMPPKLAAAPVALPKLVIPGTPLVATTPKSITPGLSSVTGLPQQSLTAIPAAAMVATKQQLTISPMITESSSPPALNPLSLDCGSSNDSGIVANSSDSEDKSLTIDLCSPGTPDSTPKKDEPQKDESTPSHSPLSMHAESDDLLEISSPPAARTPPVAPPPLLLLTNAHQDVVHHHHHRPQHHLPPCQKSPKSVVLELIRSKHPPEVSLLPEKPDDQPQESMSSDQDYSQSPSEEQQLPSSTATSESQRSTPPIDLSPPSIEIDFLAVPEQTCAKSPILSQPKTIRFPAPNGSNYNFGQKGFRRSSDGRLFGVCYWSNCDSKFDTSSKLLDHLQTEHVNSQKGPFACLWNGCKVHNKESCSRRWLERHVLSHGGSKPHKCIVAGCGMRFGSQLVLEKHVNSHFTNTESSSSGKRSSDPPVPKTLRKTGKKLRYRRQPWSARRFDFFDNGMMEGLQYRLIKTGALASGKRGAICFRGQITCRRRTEKGSEVLVKWFPNDIISDEWQPESAVKLEKEVNIHQLSMDERLELEEYLRCDRRAVSTNENSSLLAALDEYNRKQLEMSTSSQNGSSCASSSSSTSSSFNSSSNSVQPSYNSRTAPKQLRKPPKMPAPPQAGLSSALSSSSSSLSALSSCSSSSSSSSSSIISSNGSGVAIATTRSPSSASSSTS